MYISFVGDANLTRRQPVFWWNMSLKIFFFSIWTYFLEFWKLFCMYCLKLTKYFAVPGPTVEVQTQPHPNVRQALLRPPPGGQLPGGESADRPTTLPVTGEMAPPPPPRSKTGHSRSSSLDNQLIDFSDQQAHQGKLSTQIYTFCLVLLFKTPHHVIQNIQIF